MKSLYLPSVLGGLLLAVSATAASAEMYRWVDENGRVHFSDRPPADAEAQNVSGELAPINAIGSGSNRQPSSTATVKSGVSRKMDEEYRNRQLREKQQRQEKRQAACDDARSNLEAVQGRVVFIDDNGKEVRRSERQRQQIAEKLEREINRYCG
ncbi:DUF4124 domain-containing protein [Microbulbifer sp. ZKSA006]|uniref:DUF4124 domain-containing protein n=1 Tax=Microbulbifer sp. ZKSA006 TaxID=3243390 RepID=UPI00403A4218